MKITCWRILFLFWLFSGWAAGAWAQTPQEYFRQGTESYNKGVYLEAIRYYSIVLKLEPLNHSAYTARGMAKDKTGDKKGALEDFNQALAINPKYGNAYYQRAINQGESGNFKSAIEDLNRVIDLDSKPNSNVYFYRAKYRKQLGDPKGALEDYQKAIELNPKNMAAYNNRGILREGLNDLKGALEDFNKVLELDPNYSSSLGGRGGVKNKLGDYKGALDDLNRVIELNPQAGYAYTLRGIARENLGDTRGATEDFRQALAINPNSDSARKGLARLEKKPEAGPPSPTPVAPPAVDARPRLKQIPDPVVIQANWKPGDKINLVVTKEQEKSEKGKTTSKSSASIDVGMTIKSRAADGYVVEWVYGDIRLTEKPADLPPEAKEMMDMLQGMVKGMVIRFRTDATGAFKELMNLGEIKNFFKNFLNQLSNSASFKKEPQSLEYLKNVLAGLMGLAEEMLPEGDSAWTNEEISIYFDPFGLKIKKGETLKTSGALPNALGGPPLPATSLIKVEKLDLEDGTCVLEVETILDPKSTTEILHKSMAALAKKLGQKAPNRKDLPKFSSRTDTYYWFDLLSGYNHKVFLRQKTTAGETVSVKTLSIAPLVPGTASSARPSSSVSGSWWGHWMNSLGEKGTESLVLEESGDGRISGTWSGKIRVSGRRVNATTIELRGQTPTRAYEITGTFQENALTFQYLARRLDTAGSYEGTSTFTRAK
jgi:tetratricopeptide (TPR) repeat protein